MTTQDRKRIEANFLYDLGLCILDVEDAKLLLETVDELIAEVKWYEDD